MKNCFCRIRLVGFYKIHCTITYPNSSLMKTATQFHVTVNPFKISQPIIMFQNCFKTIKNRTLKKKAIQLFNNLFCNEHIKNCFFFHVLYNFFLRKCRMKFVFNKIIKKFLAHSTH